MKNYHSFNFLQKIYFERIGGSENELKAAKLIKDEVKKLGGEATLESFEVDASKIKVAKLHFTNPDIDIECAGSGYSGSTPKEGVTGEFVYVTSAEDLEFTNLKNKIVLVVQKRAQHKFYLKALKDGARAIIITTGSVYKDKKDVDLDPYLNREPDYKEGKIPTVMIRMKDAEKVVEKMPKKATVTLISEDYKVDSHNVVAEIKGNKHPNEVIAFSAHYDSVRYSKGPYDNATGAITLLQLFNYYMENKPARTLRFIWCGSEEMGLLGSKAYVIAHENDITSKYVLNVNIDMVAVTLGFDYACVTGENSVVDYIKFISREVGFPIVVKQGVYSSDSTPFADKGVPAISFARLSNNGGATIHSHDDVIERLSEPNYIKTCNFIIEATSRWINAYKFPINKVIPDNMKEELDYYLLRKERP
mgnify:CR=1 FL=1